MILGYVDTTETNMSFLLGILLTVGLLGLGLGFLDPIFFVISFLIFFIMGIFLKE